MSAPPWCDPATRGGRRVLRGCRGTYLLTYLLASHSHPSTKHSSFRTDGHQKKPLIRFYAPRKTPLTFLKSCSKERHRAERFEVIQKSLLLSATVSLSIALQIRRLFFITHILVSFSRPPLILTSASPSVAISSSLTSISPLKKRSLRFYPLYPARSSG